MKKLMIAAAIVCAAVISQAASVDWDVANNWTLADGAKAAKNTLVYLINGDTSLDTIAANHQYLADIILPSEYSDIADSVGLDIDKEVEIFL